MKITVLVENSTCVPECRAVHGLSLHLQTKTQRVLFDFGPDGDVLRGNAAALGVPLGEAGLAVLSHGHSDHGGGLAAFLQENLTAPVYIREGAFAPHWSRFQERFYPIGLEKGLETHPQVRLAGELTELGSGLLLFASPAGGALRPLFNSELFSGQENARVLDGFGHEQSLLVEENGKTVLVGGCAHGGILPILERAEELLGRPVDVAVSGFHLMAPRAGLAEPEGRLRELADAFAKRPTRYYTCHCTGEVAFRRLKAMLGEQLEGVSTGSRLEI